MNGPSRRDVVETLDAAGIHYMVSGTQATGNCPVCGDRERKFSISLETGLNKCFHANRCGWEGNLSQLREKIGLEPRKFRTADPETRTPEPMPDPVPQRRPAGGGFSNEATAFFEAKGLTAETLASFSVEMDGDKIYIPHTRAGKVVNWKRRLPIAKDKGDRMMSQMKKSEGAIQCLYNFDSATERAEMFLVEGETDCWSLAQIGIDNVFAVPNGADSYGWIEFDYENLKRFERINICLDPDDAGNKASESIAVRLGRNRCYRVTTPDSHTDWSDMLATGELTADSFLRRVARPREFTLPHLWVVEDGLDELTKAKSKGLQFRFSRLCSMLTGFHRGQTTVISGNTGGGKTRFVNDIVLSLMYMNPEARVLYCSLEMPFRKMTDWLVDQSGIIFSETVYPEFFEKVTQRRLSIYAPPAVPTVDELLDYMSYNAERRSVDFVVIDSLMCLNLAARPEDRYEMQGVLMGRLNKFAVRYDAHVMLAAHPRKRRLDSDRIGLVDIAGSSDVSNQAWNIIAIYRQIDDNHRPTDKGLLEVTKNREGGESGDISLRFDARNHRFYEEN